MKLNKYSQKLFIIATTAFLLTACNGIDNTRNNDNDVTNTRYPENVNENPYKYVTNKNRMYGNNLNKYQNKHDDDNISALNTNQNSENYPHTKAIVIQEAKYDFVKVDEEKKKQLINKIKEYANNIEAKKNAAEKQQQPPTEPQETQKQQTAERNQQAQQPTAGISEFAQQVIDLTNQHRQKNGLKPLIADAALSNVAQKKSEDMQQNNYFSHTSPTYGSPFDMIRDFGISYNSAGENIAQGQRTPEEVVNAWMNSEGHRANILNPNFTHIGVGFEETGYHWTQMFIGK